MKGRGARKEKHTYITHVLKGNTTPTRFQVRDIEER